MKRFVTCSVLSMVMGLTAALAQEAPAPAQPAQNRPGRSGLFQDAKGQIWMTAGMDGMIMSLDENGKITAWLGKLEHD